MADGDLYQADFAIWFDFTRPTTLPYLDGDGVEQTAAVDEPRFDHEMDGSSLGLLVEPGSIVGTCDRAELKPGPLDAYVDTDCTVLHARILDDGSIDRRAWYSRDPVATINAMMLIVGHHGSIGVIPEYRENKGGYVRYRGESWYLMGFIDVGDGTGAVLADDQDQPIIGA